MIERNQPAMADPADTEELLTEMRSRWGAVPSSLRMLAASPAALSAWQAFWSRFEDSELVRQRIAVFTADHERCGYRLASTSRTGAAAFEFATALARERGAVSDDAIAAARRAGLTDAQLVEVAAVVIANSFVGLIARLGGASPAESRQDDAVSRTAAGTLCRS